MRYLIITAILASIWIMAGSFIVEAKNRSISIVERFLLFPIYWLEKVTDPRITQSERERLILENEYLRAEVLLLKQQIRTSPKEFLTAKIHTRYPFNDKSLISVDLGSNDGVKKGMTATVGGNILLGQVEKVLSNYSLIKTIFTPGWQIPVRMGEIGAEGLLNGSAAPEITMVAKDKKIANGDDIFAAHKDFAYGLKIGSIKEVREGVATGVFKEVTLEVPYNINDLTELWLIK